MISSRPLIPLGRVSGIPPVLMVTTRIPCGPSSVAHCRRRPSSASRAILKPPNPVNGLRPATAEGENHARPTRDHMPRRCPGRQEVTAHRGHDRLQEVVNGDLLERLLDVTHRDQVEGDVDSARPVDNYVYKLVDRTLVERIDNAGVHRAATRLDLTGNRGELLRGSAREEDSSPFLREGAGHGSANGTAAVDDGDFLVE